MRFSLFALCLHAECTSSSDAADTHVISSLPAASEVAAGSPEVLAAATEFEIFALHPSPYSIEEGGLADAPKPFEYAQLGSAKSTAAKARFEVVSTVYWESKIATARWRHASIPATDFAPRQAGTWPDS